MLRYKDVINMLYILIEKILFYSDFNWDLDFSYNDTVSRDIKLN